MHKENRVKTIVTNFIIDFMFYWLLIPLILIMYPNSPFWYGNNKTLIVLNIILQFFIIIWPLFATMIAVHLNLIKEKIINNENEIKKVLFQIYFGLIMLFLIILILPIVLNISYENNFKYICIIGIIIDLLCMRYINNFFNKIKNTERLYSSYICKKMIEKKIVTNHKQNI